MPKVSVLIPAYNHEEFVGCAIRSVLDQHFQDFEIVITDDGSDDGTLDRIREFSDPRIRVFVHEKNRGAVAAERTCFENSAGRYIAILNSDDAFLPDKLEKQVKFLDENPRYGAVFSHAEIIDEKGNTFTDEKSFFFRIFAQPNRDRYQWLNYFFNSVNCLCHPSVLIRRECFDTLGFYDERFAQLPDFDFWVRLCMKYEIFIIPEKLVKFRVLSDNRNASGESREAQIRHSVELFEILHHFLSIPAYNDFITIFPRTDITLDQKDDDFIPFYLAKLGLEKKSPVYHLFAISILYSLFSDREMIMRLQEKFGFSTADLIEITGSSGVFRDDHDEKRDEIQKRAS
jgi:glycosyltransferase involved in cell wall biosynthesis